ncbi:hypothetical protein VP150E351_P0194 [Vibrio phage 150E35-1]|nr:hypothetical protein VP150E351_P0194 [Vibrio phage 150E35-1]
MDRSKVENEVVNYLNEEEYHLDMSSTIELTTSMSDLTMDSLDTVELAMELEERLDMQFIPEDPINSILDDDDKTVADLVSLIINHGED